MPEPAQNSPATGAPTITGTALVGETLTVDTSGIADADGLANVSYSYQWISNDGTSDTDITSATDSTYTLVADDEGKAIKVRVTFTDDTGIDETLISDATVAVAAQSSPNAGAPTIKGTAKVGETLTVDTTGMAQGLVRTAFSYKWISNDGTSDNDIPNATDSTYTLVAADEGKTIKVQVTFTNDQGNQESLTSDATPAVAARANSAATGVPVITGTTQVSETLTADVTGIADADGLTGATFSYQWISNDGTSDMDITGATDYTYTLVTADEGKTIKVRVTFTDDAANGESLTSDATGAVAARPNSPATGAPAIIGTAQVGEMLTADTSGIADADGLSGATFRYHWIGYINGDIDFEFMSATDSTYTLVADDEGNTFKVSVSFTDEAGYGESLTSDATGAVAPRSNSPATGAPAIIGTAQVGETLTADTSGISDADGLSNVSHSYQWISNDGTTDTDIAGATDSTYTLVAVDQGNTIKVQVTFTDDAANEETLVSAATVAIAAMSSPNAGAPTIKGTAKVGETLTVDTTGMAQGLVRATFSYQWISNDGSADTNIPNATNFAYILVASDEGRTIKVLVSFTNDQGNQESLTSDATTAVAARANSAATGAPAITGTARVGETLTADTSGIADADGLANVSYSYQWVSNDGTSDTNITGATDSTYVLVADDEGKTIKVRVSFTDDANNKETLTSAATTAVAAAAEADDGDESSLRSYITVVVADDQSDPDNVVTSLAITWSDVDECSSGYNAFISNSPEDGHTHLGSAASDGAQITSSLTNITRYYVFFDVDLYCGTQEWGRRVSGVKIPYIDGRLLPDTYSSEPPLTGLTVNHGTLAPAFHSHTFGYTVPDVANSARRITVNVTAKDGYEYQIAPMEGENSYIVGYNDPWRLSEWFISYSPSGNPFEPLSDADADSPGFQIDLEGGENQFQIRVYRPGCFGDFYKLTITRAPGPPGAPQHLNVSPHDSGALDLHWEAPASDGGSEITGHRVQWKEAAGSWDTPADVSETTVTGTTHTITGLTDGVQYTVRVIAVNDLGDSDPSEEAAGTPGEAGSPDPAQNTPATGAPTITGTAQVGETLTADTTGIADADGLANVSYSYQWLSSRDTEIQDATASTYTLVAADEGKTIKVRVSFTDDAANNETLTSDATVAVAAEPPTRPKGLTGTVAHDAVSLTWDDPGDATITGYKILRRDRALHGNGDFQVHVDDTGSAAAAYIDRDVSPEGSYVYRIKARNAAGLSGRSGHFRADTPSAPAQNSPATGAPDIGGTARVGETLSADVSGIADSDGLSGATFSYQWVANDGNTDTDIAGATDSTYTLAASDEGSAIKVRVSFTDDAGYAETLSSAATAAVAAQNSPAIEGVVRVGETLTVDTSGIADELSGVTLSYQWVSNDGTTDTDIAGATGSTYTLTASDEGKIIKVRVTFTLTSAATEEVEADGN